MSAVIFLLFSKLLLETVRQYHPLMETTFANSQSVNFYQLGAIYINDWLETLLNSNLQKEYLKKYWNKFYQELTSARTD